MVVAEGGRYVHGWVEVAPPQVISHKKCSNFPKLETIAEEGSESLEILPKRVVFLLPVFFSLVSYLILYSQIV
ncbi:transmembrane protein [Pyrus ussuriensis x Pyrus communis]|uniref:Transmembrane protein n=1 Tax=Pyrus ussuriensis x Pyrus communis TaxID=2448454 RepID=A0A5N5H2I2_9ROSA|nr:transmembrane protein [Pyrus ussuriensis x Pyrus communis]